MRDSQSLLDSLKIHTEQSIRRQRGDTNPKFLWSGYGAIILRNRIAVLRVRGGRDDDSFGRPCIHC
jgi:hypothetical protein